MLVESLNGIDVVTLLVMAAGFGGNIQQLRTLNHTMQQHIKDDNDRFAAVNRDIVDVAKKTAKIEGVMEGQDA